MALNGLEYAPLADDEDAGEVDTSALSEGFPDWDSSARQIAGDKEASRGVNIPRHCCGHGEEGLHRPLPTGDAAVKAAGDAPAPTR